MYFAQKNLNTNFYIKKYFKRLHVDLDYEYVKNELTNNKNSHQVNSVAKSPQILIQIFVYVFQSLCE